MVHRRGSWEHFHRYIRWNVPPRPEPSPAPPPQVPAARKAAAAAGGTREPVVSGLGAVLTALWQGFRRNP